jgi:nucleoside-diphosphate-sugar epimerase
VTGANGFVGANLCNHLTRYGYDVKCLVRKGSDLSLIEHHSKIQFCDYNNLLQLEQILSQFHVVIHLAAMTKAKQFDTLYDANVRLTENIVNIVNKSPECIQLIFISSQAAVGPSKGKIGKKENDSPAPISWYGTSKALAEEKIKKCTKEWTMIRPSSVYGEGDKDFLHYFKMIKYRIAPIPGIETKYLSFIYVKDLIAMIEKSILNRNVYGKVLHASDGVVYTIEGFINVLASVMEKKCIKFNISNKMLSYNASVLDYLFQSSSKPLVFNKQKALELSQESWIIDSSSTFDILGMNISSNMKNNLYNTYQWYLQKKWI